MNYEKILQPKINPFRLFIYSLKENSIILKSFSQEKINSTKLSKLNSQFSYCNSFHDLFISEANNFWIINHSSFQTKYKKMPIQKTGHSLSFIPNEDGKIFIVGGNDKKSFYYDLKKNYFLNWAETNFIHINPALINIGEYLYIIDTNKNNNNNKIIFERTKLNAKKKAWEIIEPKYDENIINNFINEFYGVSLDSKGNIIFIGGNNINMENNTTYVYNIDENRIHLSNQGTNDNMIFKERTFYFYDNNYNVALPENLDEIKEIAFVDKNEQSLIKTNIDFVEKNIKYNFNNININNKNEQIKQKSRIIRNENIPKEYGYYMSSYSSAQAKLNAKKNKIDVIETNKTNKIVINIPINNKQKLDEQNEIKIQKESKEIKIEENYVDQKIEEQEQNNIEIIQDENMNMNMNMNNNIQYEEINTDNKPNEENINQKYEKEIIDNINNEKNIEQEEINNNNIKIENNLDIEHKEENYEEQENKIEGEENNEEIEEHFEQEEKEHEQENEYENEYENMNEQNENEHYEEHEEQQQQIINEQEDLQENEQIKIGEENNNEQEQEQEQEQNYEYEEHHEVEQEQKVEPIENVEEKEQEQEQHYEEHQEINEQEQEQENNEEQNYEENKDINIQEEEIQEHIQENNLENELNNLNQKSNAETLENPNEFENQQKTEEKHNEKENTEQNQQTQEKILDNLEETETPVEIDIEKLEKRLDNIMNQKLEEGNIKFNEVITKETIKESNNEISIQKNTDINIIEGDEKFHIEIKEQTTPLQNGSTEQKNEVLSSQEKSPNVFISGEENVEQDENEEMNEGENVEEEENGEYEEQERDTLLKTITENIGEDVMQIPDYLIAYYNEENFCDYEP